MSDSLGSSLLTVRPSGQVSAEFTGVIHAEPGSTVDVEALAGQIKETDIEDEAISTPKVAANAITGAKVAAGTLTAEHVAAGSLTANELSVEELSAISAKMGTLTSGSIVGAEIKTGAKNPKVLIDPAGITGYDGGANAKFHFDTATGILYAIGILSSEDGSELFTKHLAGQISETQIEDEAISTPLLAANAVTAAKMSVGELSAISADLGTVTAGTLKAVTIEAAQISAAEAFSMIETPERAESNQLRWFDELTGETLRAGISAYSPAATDHTMDLAVIGAVAEAHVVLRGRDKTFPSAGRSAQVVVEAGAHQLVVLDEEVGPRSDFLQLVETSKKTLDSGSTFLTYPGGASGSKETEVAHSLDVAPERVIATVKDDGASGVQTWKTLVRCTKRDSEKLWLRAEQLESKPASGSKVQVDWVAIG